MPPALFFFLKIALVILGLFNVIILITSKNSTSVICNTSIKKIKLLCSAFFLKGNYKN